MKNQFKVCLAAVLCAGLLFYTPRAEAAEIPEEVQAEFDRLIEIGAGDILDQFLSSLPEDVRNALVEAEEQKYARYLRPHFDIAQKQILIWKDYQDLAHKLTEWIKALFA